MQPLSVGFGVISFLVASCTALDTVVSADLNSDVTYVPQGAWFTDLNSGCQTIDRYTDQINASASLTFQGNKVQIAGMTNNASGVMRLIIDDEDPYDIDLHSDVVNCIVFVDYTLPTNGVHNMTLLLKGPSAEATSGLADDGLGTTFPVMHLTDISYVIPDETPSSPSSSANRHTGAIVGGTVGGVLFLLLIALGLFFYFKRRMPWQKKSRHAFDPTRSTKVDITELSPRSPRGETKLQPYLQMSDDRDHSASDTKEDNPFDDGKAVDYNHLGVPTLAYQSKSGLRSRSRSPVPKRGDECA